MPQARSSSTEAARARRAAERLGASDFLLERVAEDIAERLAAVLRQFDLAVDLGTPATRCGARWRQAARSARLSRPSPSAVGPLAVAADEEALPFRDGALDLVVSALSLQFVNDLPGALVQIRRALKPDGLFLAALLGGDTLTELRQAFAQAEAEIEDGDLAAGRAVCRCARARRACCSARALRCRSPTSTASPCATRRRSR